MSTEEQKASTSESLSKTQIENYGHPQSDANVKGLEIQTSKGEGKIAGELLFTPAFVAVVKKTVAKGTTDTELFYFLQVCQSMNLNPLNKEVWCYKDGRGNLLVFSGRDGMLAKAQRDPRYNGMRSAEIRENDEFELDIPNGIVHHKIKELSPDKRGKILGAYAYVYLKDGEPTLEFVALEDYDKSYNAWKTHKAEMIKKVAECHALKKSLGMSGIQVEHDWNFEKGYAEPIQTERVTYGQIGYLENLLDNSTLDLHKKEAMTAEVSHDMSIHRYKEMVRYLIQNQVPSLDDDLKRIQSNA